MKNPSRRHFLAAALAAQPASRAQAASPYAFSVFSKHLHFLGWPEMAAVAKEIGFDGIDLTVRKGGHVLPERATEDLPKAKEAIERAGLQLTMITSDVVDVSSPHAVAVLRTAAKLGVKHYRWGGFRYQENGKSPADQLAELRPKVKELAALNRELGLCAMYHTHSGVNQIGASMWDLWLLLKDHDPAQVSFNYDIGHATVEGGLGGWVHSARLAAPFTRGVALKDFRWEKGPKGWRVQWCPIGEGMVQFDKYFPMMKASGFRGPLQVHYEYDLGGADKGLTKITIEPKQVFAAMRKDLVALKSLLG
ncbi:MAG: sugar phosphate isomerase/epimerase [Acidobacteria bacterium]|nr:sugar phosphate isomerase/epimerase [Acidobacteriota bacterium]